MKISSFIQLSLCNHLRSGLIALLVIVMAALTGLSSCSTLLGPEATAHGLKFKQDVWLVENGKKKAKKVKEGKTVQIKEFPVMVHSPGYVSVLLLGKNDPEKTATVDLKPMSNWLGDELDYEANLKLHEIVSTITQIQFLIQNQKASEALARSKELLKKYPNYTFIKFIQASCHMVLGQKSEAKVLLEKALNDFPEYEQGHRLYESITGVTYKPVTRSIASKKKKRKSSADEESDDSSDEEKSEDESDSDEESEDD